MLSCREAPPTNSLQPLFWSFAKPEPRRGEGGRREALLAALECNHLGPVSYRRRGEEKHRRSSITVQVSSDPSTLLPTPCLHEITAVKHCCCPREERRLALPRHRGLQDLCNQAVQLYRRKQGSLPTPLYRSLAPEHCRGVREALLSAVLLHRCCQGSGGTITIVEGGVADWLAVKPFCDLTIFLSC